MTQRGVQLRVPDPASRPSCCRCFGELEVPIESAVIGARTGTAVQVTEPRRADRATYTGAGGPTGVDRCRPPDDRGARRRSTALGTTEPNIQRQGEDRVLVQVPGLQDPERLKAILGETAQLEFRFLANPGDSDVEMLPSQDLGGEPVAGRAPGHRRRRGT